MVNLNDLIRALREESMPELWQMLDDIEHQSDSHVKAAARRIREKLMRLADGNSVIRLEALQTAQDAVKAEMRVLAHDQWTLLETGMLAAAVIGFRPFTAEALTNKARQLYGNAAAEQLTIRLRVEMGGVLSKESAAARAASLNAQLRETPLPDGLTLSRRVWRIERGAEQALADLMNAAVIKGWDAEHTLLNAMRDGKAVLSPELRAALGAAKADRLSAAIEQGLTQKPGNVAAHYRRLLTTEINRRNGEAFMESVFANKDAAGVRYRLSPNHRVVDICDVHANADLHGLGPGVYPSRASYPFMPHPRCKCYGEPVFKDEITNNPTRADMIPSMDSNLPPRADWGNFPDVVIHAPELNVKKHPDYAAAKSGDADAAYKLVKDSLSPAAIKAIQDQLNGRKPILTSAHALERTGVNAIPEAMADVLGAHLRLPVDSSIVQTNVVGHTGAGGFARIARQAAFDGDVLSGAEYYLVDDFIGQGGTLANLKGHIESKGGIVLGATALTGKPYSAKLKPSQEQLLALRGKHGEELERWWVNRFGYSFDRLTQSEARYLERTPDTHTIRDRITKEEQE